MIDNISSYTRLFSFGAGNAVGLCLTKAGPWPEAEMPLSCLHPEERRYWEQLKVEKRKMSYVLGRHAAKQAACSIAPDIPTADILIRPGLFGQPVLIHPELANRQVTISHTERLAACLAFPESVPAGIDIEELLTEERAGLAQSYFVPGELELAMKAGLSFREAATLLWTAKESLSKCLRTGLTTPLSVYEIGRADVTGRWVVSSFAKFPQYRAFSWLFKGAVLSIVLPSIYSHEPPDLYRLLEPGWME
ncbi:4'-phosphopantetheinyl transferase family protein [Paenibacillus aurantiacus]|uniref:4'-phosphopantetheinyl transferase family protein n=1 Tax=Paenibacillus aurantiacus TaxID=1936118 RepID=A0ABV5KLK5_9BACL